MAVNPIKDKEGQHRQDNLGRLLWRIDYYPAGRKGKRVWVRFAGSRVEAEILHLELRRARHARPPVMAKVKDLVPYFLEHCRGEMTAATMRDLQSVVLRHLVPFFGDMMADSITGEVVDQYKSTRSQALGDNTGRPMSKRTINKELSYLSSLCRWALERGYIIAMPRISRFKRVRPPKPRPLSMDEVDRILAAIEQPYRLPVLLMCDAGLRLTEAVRMRGEDVYLEKGLLYVRGKGGKERLVPIMTRRLRQALDAAPRKGYLSINPKTGKPWHSLRQALYRAGRIAGTAGNVTHHRLRHSFGTNAILAGMGLRSVQEILGHSSPTVTQIYTTLAAEHLREDGAKFAALAEGAENSRG